MYKVNDEIQSCASAFGERFFLQAAYTAMEDECTHTGTKKVLEKVIYLHMISYVNENMGWYLRHKFVNPAAASDLHKKQDLAVKDLVPHINTILEGFGLLMTEQIHAPMARDYIKFNGQKDMDDHNAAEGIFDFKKGATQQSQYRPRM